MIRANRILSRIFRLATLLWAALTCALATLGNWYAAAAAGITLASHACANHLSHRARREEAIAARLATLRATEPLNRSTP